MCLSAKTGEGSSHLLVATLAATAAPFPITADTVSVGNKSFPLFLQHISAI